MEDDASEMILHRQNNFLESLHFSFLQCFRKSVVHFLKLHVEAAKEAFEAKQANNYCWKFNKAVREAGLSASLRKAASTQDAPRMWLRKSVRVNKSKQKTGQQNAKTMLKADFTSIDSLALFLNRRSDKTEAL